MPRLKISLPSSLALFSTDFSIQVGDLNYGGHLGNERIYLFCQEMRIRFFKEYNQSELDFLNSSLIMSDSACIYKKEGHWGDVLRGKLYVGEFSPFGFEFYYQFHFLPSEKEMARAKTGMVFFDYGEKKLQKAPQNLVQWFQERS